MCFLAADVMRGDEKRPRGVGSDCDEPLVAMVRFAGADVKTREWTALMLLLCILPLLLPTPMPMITMPMRGL